MTSSQHTSIELLVDLFLEGNLEEEEPPYFTAEGCVDEVHDVDAHDGEVELDEDHQLMIKKCGRELSSMGDDMNQKYTQSTHKSLPTEVKALFQDKQERDEETRWFSFKELMDRAVKDIGEDDSLKVLATVLVSVKGLHMLGSGVKNYVLRYIGERKLDKDIKRLDTMKHPEVD